MAEELAALLAKKFISRRDVQAVQQGDGAYFPERRPFTMGDLRAHVDGSATLGHYLLDQDDKCKLFAFDIDLVAGWKPDEPHPDDPKWLDPIPMYGKMIRPVDEWKNPDCDPDVRMALLCNLRSMSGELAACIERNLGIETAVAYSGNKGVHVYGFTGHMMASRVRRAALAVLNSYDGAFVPTRGDNFYRWFRGSLGDTLSIEVFPKQDSLSGKDLGNLLRLPCGVHRKSGQRGHFIDPTSEWDALHELDPIVALTNGGKPLNG